MINKIIQYLGLVLIIFVISVYVKNYDLLYATIFVLVLPLIDMLLIKVSAKRIKINVDIKNTMINKGEVIPIDTKIINKGILPIVMIEFKFICENLIHKKDRDIILQFPIMRWGKQECIFFIKSEYCGDLKIELDHARCIDYLGFFSQEIVKKFRKVVYILPNVNNIETIKIDHNMSLDLEGTEFSKYKSGDDPSEVFDIRSYRPGDKMHSIHWKLSSRKKEYMVKEYSLPVNSNFSVIMDLTEIHDDMEREIDAVIEVTLDIILKLQEEGISHQLIAYERNGKYIYKDIIDCQISMLDVMYELYQSSVQRNCSLLEDYDLKNELNDETNVYYVGGYINETVLGAFDNIFPRASKTYVYLYDGNKDHADFEKIEGNKDVKVVPININELNEGLSNI